MLRIYLWLKSKTGLGHAGKSWPRPAHWRCGGKRRDLPGSYGYGLSTGNSAAICHSLSHCHAVLAMNAALLASLHSSVPQHTMSAPPRRTKQVPGAISTPPSAAGSVHRQHPQRTQRTQKKRRLVKQWSRDISACLVSPGVEEVLKTNNISFL